MHRVIRYVIGGVVGVVIGSVIGGVVYNKQYSPRTYFTPGVICEDEIITHINNADKIDIAVYIITNDKIINALDNAHKRGAQIRVITDDAQSNNQYSLVPNLRDMGIRVKTNASKCASGKRVHKSMHNKFAIFDNATVVTGSYNWATSAISNAENCVFSKRVTPEYVREFEYLWDLYN